MDRKLAIIEVGSNNTKTHIYEGSKELYRNVTTIPLKKNYQQDGKISESDLGMLMSVVEKACEYTRNVHIFGCSIFRNISDGELEEINERFDEKFGTRIEVVTQEDEAYYTALGVYSDIDYEGKICVFIGGGGSIELLFIEDKKVVDKKYYEFGVVDVTKKYESLKNDVPDCTFKEVYDYVNELMGDLDASCDVLVLAGGDHPYWYRNAQYELIRNTLYENEKQKLMLTVEMSDKYDEDSFKASLDAIRNRSDNPLWFDGARAMKVITNSISHKIGAKYIVPTSINMEDGLKAHLENEENC